MGADVHGVGALQEELPRKAPPQSTRPLPGADFY